MMNAEEEWWMLRFFVSINRSYGSCGILHGGMDSISEGINHNPHRRWLKTSTDQIQLCRRQRGQSPRLLIEGMSSDSGGKAMTVPKTRDRSCTFSGLRSRWLELAKPLGSTIPSERWKALMMPRHWRFLPKWVVRWALPHGQLLEELDKVTRSSSCLSSIPRESGSRFTDEWWGEGERGTWDWQGNRGIACIDIEIHSEAFHFPRSDPMLDKGQRLASKHYKDYTKDERIYKKNWQQKKKAYTRFRKDTNYLSSTPNTRAGLVFSP